MSEYDLLVVKAHQKYFGELFPRKKATVNRRIRQRDIPQVVITVSVTAILVVVFVCFFMLAYQQKKWEKEYISDRDLMLIEVKTKKELMDQHVREYHK
jgi:hypothetical protein